MHFPLPWPNRIDVFRRTNIHPRNILYLEGLELLPSDVATGPGKPAHDSYAAVWGEINKYTTRFPDLYVG